jgi:hypothetical protein
LNFKIWAKTSKRLPTQNHARLAFLSVRDVISVAAPRIYVREWSRELLNRVRRTSAVQLPIETASGVGNQQQQQQQTYSAVLSVVVNRGCGVGAMD